MTSEVLVVVPTLGDRPHWLEASINSILEQRSEDISVDLVVVAPSSADVRGICASADISLVRCDDPGLSRAINIGWRSGQQEFIAWLGDDDLLAPNSLIETVRALKNSPSAAFSFGQVRYIDADGRTLWFQRTGRWAVKYMKFGKNLVPQQGSLFRRSCVERAGGLREDLKAAMDQAIFDLLSRNHPYVYVAKELAAFRIHDTNITVTKSGPDEGDALRAGGIGTSYSAIRRVTTLTDRVIYGTIRRLPFPESPLTPNGRPYTEATIAV